MQYRLQCDQIGRFWNFLATNFTAKVAEMFGDFLCSFENHSILSQFFWATFGKTWATFYSNILSHCSSSKWTNTGRPLFICFHLFITYLQLMKWFLTSAGFELRSLEVQWPLGQHGHLQMCQYLTSKKFLILSVCWSFKWRRLCLKICWNKISDFFCFFSVKIKFCN